MRQSRQSKMNLSSDEHLLLAAMLNRVTGTLTPEENLLQRYIQATAGYTTRFDEVLNQRITADYVGTCSSTKVLESVFTSVQPTNQTGRV